ncbi:intraflagellar transport protein 88 homolog [Culex quinquefasciatus]|uniref:intraflagellar transport protein 88 homolog n=1 Tax=Culex quinquefasciatus TaxID=7176 RepID=UPI0018E3608F|nr:intraflagellar transport protein 88 homolog [Culex quinquefasciatus]
MASNFDDDIYGGFSGVTNKLFNYDAKEDKAFQNAIKTSSYGKKTSTPKFFWNGEKLGSADGTATMARPSTAIRPVGYSSQNSKLFDPLNQAAKKIVVMESKKEETPEQRYKNMETKIYALLEESIIASTGAKPDMSAGLAKAKEASSLDRTLLRMRDQDGGTYTHNFDLTFFVLFNLANVYAKNEMYIEALNTYTLMTKNKMFPNVNRLKINMGNIYFQLGLYTKAIKMYRMALDQVPSNQKELRLKITHNIGILFIKMGQYSDAATSFEFIMSEKGDLKTGLHLILCYYALGDVEKIKHAFQLLLDIQVDYLEDEKVFQTNSTPSYEYINEMIKSDELHAYEQKIRHLAEKNILISANLISTIIDDYFNDGYSWCVETIKNSYFSSLAVDLELKKAVIYLKQDDIQQAIDTLKYFEKKESNIAINAAINLSFIHILKKDITTAESYADTAKKIDSYCPAAFINSGVCSMMKEDLETAKLMFMNALDIDSTSFEALYNIGLIFKKLGDHNNSLLYFRKIISNLGHEQHPEVLYQIASLYDLLGDVGTALEYYLQLLSLVQQDNKIIQKIGELYETDGERQQAYHYHHESYRIYPIDSSVINWLCSHYIELQVVEKAIGFYEKAVLKNPQDPYYLLRIAGCYRRIGNQQKSLSLFKMIHEIYPENADCLRALIHLNQQQGNNELVEKYGAELQKLEKQKEVRQRIGTGRPPTTAGGSRISSGEHGARSGGMDSYQPPGTASGSGSGFGAANKSADVSPDYNAFSNAYGYADPLGPAQERPRTGIRRNLTVEDDSDEEINPYDLLPV